VYPHIGDVTNLAGYPSLKPNIIFCVYLLDHNLSLSMDHQFKEDRWRQDWRFQVSLQRKSISGTYLIYRLSARGRATSKHGGGGRYDAIFRVQRGAILKKVKRAANEKKSKLRCESLVTECMRKKWMNEKKNERKKERKKEEKKRKIWVCAKIKWTPQFSKSALGNSRLQD
jgi:hypothetical protein